MSYAKLQRTLDALKYDLRFQREGDWYHESVASDPKKGGRCYNYTAITKVISQFLEGLFLHTIASEFLPKGLLGSQFGVLWWGAYSCVSPLLFALLGAGAHGNSSDVIRLRGYSIRLAFFNNEDKKSDSLFKLDKVRGVLGYRIENRNFDFVSGYAHLVFETATAFALGTICMYLMPEWITKDYNAPIVLRFLWRFVITNMWDYYMLNTSMKELNKKQLGDLDTAWKKYKKSVPADQAGGAQAGQAGGVQEGQAGGAQEDDLQEVVTTEQRGDLDAALSSCRSEVNLKYTEVIVVRKELCQKCSNMLQHITNGVDNTLDEMRSDLQKRIVDWKEHNIGKLQTLGNSGELGTTLEKLGTALEKLGTVLEKLGTVLEKSGESGESGELGTVLKEFGILEEELQKECGELKQLLETRQFLTFLQFCKQFRSCKGFLETQNYDGTAHKGSDPLLETIKFLLVCEGHSQLQCKWSENFLIVVEGGDVPGWIAALNKSAEDKVGAEVKKAMFQHLQKEKVGSQGRKLSSIAHTYIKTQNFCVESYKTLYALITDKELSNDDIRQMIMQEATVLFNLCLNKDNELLVEWKKEHNKLIEAEKQWSEAIEANNQLIEANNKLNKAKIQSVTKALQSAPATAPAAPAAPAATAPAAPAAPAFQSVTKEVEALQKRLTYLQKYYGENSLSPSCIKVGSMCKVIITLLAMVAPYMGTGIAL